MSDSRKLEDVNLYKIVTRIATYADGLLTEFPEEEKWGLASKIRTRALDVTTDIAEALGSIDPRDKKWFLGMARRDLFGLKNSLKVSHSRKYVDINPEIMVALDKAVSEVDLAIKQAEANIPKWFDEMRPPSKKDKE